MTWCTVRESDSLSATVKRDLWALSIIIPSVVGLTALGLGLGAIVRLIIGG
jgi:hypothetical protein